MAKTKNSFQIVSPNEIPFPGWMSALKSIFLRSIWALIAPPYRSRRDWIMCATCVFSYLYCMRQKKNNNKKRARRHKDANAIFLLKQLSRSRSSFQPRSMSQRAEELRTFIFWLPFMADFNLSSAVWFVACIARGASSCLRFRSLISAFYMSN